MEKLRNRLNRIEGKLRPPGEPVIITGHSKKEVKRKEREYLEREGNPDGVIVRLVAAKINKRPKVRH